MVKHFFLAILYLQIFLLFGCVTFKTKKLTLEKEQYVNNPKLKFDGIYFSNMESSDGIHKWIEILLFYQNGYFYKTTHLNMDEAKRNLADESNFGTSNPDWGCYRTVSDTIKLQYFVPTGDAWFHIWDVVNARGVIKDSSIIFRNIEYSFLPLKVNHDGKNWLIGRKKK